MGRRAVRADPNSEAIPNPPYLGLVPAAGQDELDEDAMEVLLNACGEAVEEAGGELPG